MTRPFYETQEQVEAERRIIERLGKAWGCSVAKAKRAYHIDWVIGESPRVAFVEVKDRSTYGWEFLDAHGGVYVSALKWGMALMLSWTTGVPVMLLVQTAGGELWWHRLAAREHDGVRMGGRVDRGDPQDVEPCVMLRSTRFKRLQEPTSETQSQPEPEPF